MVEGGLTPARTRGRIGRPTGDVPGADDPVIALEAYRVRHLAVDRAALEDVSLEVRRGELVAVLGAEGAGATTLLSSLNGIVPQLAPAETSGSIRVLGADPRAVPVREWARHVGLVLDDPGLVATSATVADEVAFGLENLGVPSAEMGALIADALAAVGLGGFGERPPTTLSGGELQRLAIACAIVTGPTVLALDEPSASLDAPGRRALAETIRRLRAERAVTVLVADRDAEASAAEATRVVALGAGRVVADGPAAAVLGRPAALAEHGIRSTGAAELAAALGLPPPVPTDAAGLARALAGAPVRAVAPAGGAPPTAGRPVVVFHDVWFRYPGSGRDAVAGVSLAVGESEVVGIVGANGCGKTTLGRLAQGLLRPERGRVLADGLDTRARPARALAAHVGSLFQEPSHQLFASTVRDEIALGPQALGLAREEALRRAAGVAEELGLGGTLGLHPLRLPRAVRRRVALAAVLAMRPSALVLDEPTAGADARATAAVEDQIRRLAADGRAILIASHDLAFLGRVASRLVVLRDGRVLADGPVRTAFADGALLAAAGLEAPAAARVALALAPAAEGPWPPVTVEEAVAALGPERRP